ncbi:hypothetical protein EOM82_03225 [bacterium]|nr:hypothetical protein [bacterium]
METKIIKNHSFRYDNGKIFITGVISVDSFDDKDILVRLSDNAISLKGQDFLVEEMNVETGLLSVSGKLWSLIYRDKAEKLPFFKRLLK